MYTNVVLCILCTTTDQQTPGTGKRWKSKSGQKIGKERSTSEEGPLPSKMSSAKKQLKTDFSAKKSTIPDEPPAVSSGDDIHQVPSTKDTSNGQRGGECSLTKLIGKAVPFLSDISSSESESELPLEAKAKQQQEDSPSLPSEQKEREEGEGEERERGGEGAEEKEVGSLETEGEGESEELSSVKEEATVKISHDQDQGLTAPGKYTFTCGLLHNCLYVYAHVQSQY